jgi:type IV pilus assembly protein PilP
MTNLFRLFLVSAVVVLTACASEDDSDLRTYIANVKARPAGAIDPVPSFRPYEAFNYGAMLLRSPFDRPVVELQQLLRSAGKKIQPDLNREREHLENYSVSVLKMVGTIEKDSTLWALVSDDRGGVHRVRQGNYIGRNHGHVVSISQAQIEFMEIVSDGLNGWIERPRSLRIEDKE